MPLDITRLKNKIIQAFDESAEHTNANAARDRIALNLATAIIEEIKELRIAYSSGLIAPNGAVSGTITHTVQ